MTRFAANLSMLFTELPFAQRFAAAASAGFGGVEFAFTDELAADDIAQLLRQHQLVQVLGTLPGAASDKGLAAAPGAEDAFAQRLAKGLSAAVAARCPVVHVTTGVVAEAAMREASNTFLSNMRLAAREAHRHDVTLVIEAINPHDLPGYFIRSLPDALAWVERIGHPRVRLLVDFYHAHMEGLPASVALAAVASHGAHVQIAGAPGRAEPGTGALDCAHVFQQLDAQGYTGWVGCEYRPASSTVAGLGWRHALRPRTLTS